MDTRVYMQVQSRGTTEANEGSQLDCVETSNGVWVWWQEGIRWGAFVVSIEPYAQKSWNQFYYSE